MKLAVVGTGMIAQEVLPQLRGWGWEPAALCATPRSAAQAEQLCRENGVPAVFTDYAQMLEGTETDAVYIAVPNFLHHGFAMQALERGKNVIVEKPMTGNSREAEELAALAKAKGLYLFEAISTLYLPNYRKTQEWLARIGTVKLVSCNFSQYSHRYDAFRRGETPPVFDPAKAGGALMDINLYNLHWLLGLFGAPQKVRYAANIERGIDTSGALLLEYDGFQAVSVAAKDCGAPCRYLIQGTQGYIEMDSPANFCRDVKLHLNDGHEETFAENPASRLEPEFRFFAEQIASGGRGQCYEQLKHSLTVSRVQTAARLGAGIRFPADGAQ